MCDVAIALGGNSGGFAAATERFAAAQRMLEDLCGAPAMRSRLYQSAPMGPVADQPDFVNAALSVRAPRALSAHKLLELLLGFERRCGRQRKETGGPRPIDLDILWYGELELVSEELCLPHPRLAERAFVILPLCDLYGEDFVVPVLGERLGDLRASVADQVIRPLEPLDRA